MYSHFWYDAPASRLATYYAKGGAPVFLYSLDHISENFEFDSTLLHQYSIQVSTKINKLAVSRKMAFPSF